MISNSGPVLTALAEQICTAHEAVKRHVASATAAATECGKALIEAKSAVPHGEWLAWLRANCRLSERTAQAYMRLARRFGDGNPQRVADSSLRQALAAIALSRPTRRERLINECGRLHGEDIVDIEDALEEIRAELAVLDARLDFPDSINELLDIRDRAQELLNQSLELRTKAAAAFAALGISSPTTIGAKIEGDRQ